MELLKDVLPAIPLFVGSIFIGWIQFLKYRIDVHNPIRLSKKEKELLQYVWRIGFEVVGDDMSESIDRGAYFVQLFRGEDLSYGEMSVALPVSEYGSAMKRLCEYGLMEMKIREDIEWNNGVPPKMHSSRIQVIGLCLEWEPTQYGQLYYYSHIGSKKRKRREIGPETWEEKHEDFSKRGDV